MRRRRWYERWLLPKTPDIVGILRDQLAVTIAGVEAFARWAHGDAEAAGTVREAERRGDAAKRELLTALREAFVMPLASEDVFALSRGIDWILNYTCDLINESEAMRSPPDAGIAEMAELLAESVRHLDDAIARLDTNGEEAAAAADAAIKAERRLDHAYYDGMAALLEVDDMRERISRRELYRRCERIGDIVIDVAERVVYAVMKQS
jgi:uncharacterized protein Yka (UPF0111/DUF47 family)